MSGKPIVILDANALMMPFQHGINLDLELKRLVGECEVLVPSSVLGELRRQSADRIAKAAARLAEKYRIVEVEESGDASLFVLAREKSGIVVTNDKELIGQLRQSRIPVIHLRSRTHLVLDDGT